MKKKRIIAALLVALMVFQCVLVSAENLTPAITQNGSSVTDGSDILVSKENPSGEGVKKSYIKFNAEDIPSDFTKVELELYSTRASNGATDVFGFDHADITEADTNWYSAYGNDVKTLGVEANATYTDIGDVEVSASQRASLDVTDYVTKVKTTNFDANNSPYKYITYLLSGGDNEFYSKEGAYLTSNAGTTVFNQNFEADDLSWNATGSATNITTLNSDTYHLHQTRFGSGNYAISSQVTQDDSSVLQVSLAPRGSSFQGSYGYIRFTNSLGSTKAALTSDDIGKTYKVTFKAKLGSLDTKAPLNFYAGFSPIGQATQYGPFYGNKTNFVVEDTWQTYEIYQTVTEAMVTDNAGYFGLTFEGEILNNTRYLYLDDITITELSGIENKAPRLKVTTASADAYVYPAGDLYIAGGSDSSKLFGFENTLKAVMPADAETDGSKKATLSFNVPNRNKIASANLVFTIKEDAHQTIGIYNPSNDEIVAKVTAGNDNTNTPHVVAGEKTINVTNYIKGLSSDDVKFEFKGIDNEPTTVVYKDYETAERFIKTTDSGYYFYVNSTVTTGWPVVSEGEFKEGSTANKGFPRLTGDATGNRYIEMRVNGADAQTFKLVNMVNEYDVQTSDTRTYRVRLKIKGSESMNGVVLQPMTSARSASHYNTSTNGSFSTTVNVTTEWQNAEFTIQGYNNTVAVQELLNAIGVVIPAGTTGRAVCIDDIVIEEITESTGYIKAVGETAYILNDAENAPKLVVTYMDDYEVTNTVATKNNNVYTVTKTIKNNTDDKLEFIAIMATYSDANETMLTAVSEVGEYSVESGESVDASCVINNLPSNSNKAKFFIWKSQESIMPIGKISKSTLNVADATGDAE